MDLSAKKKRNTDAIIISTEPLLQTNDDAKKIISYFTLEQLQSIIATAIVDPSSVLPYVRAVADKDPSQRKLFIRGLGEETTNESLHSLFSSFGELQGACAICDKSTGKCKGYGFVTFQHIDGAILALQEPMKKIDGRMAVAQLATAADVSLRKVYVGNVPRQMPRDRLLQLFSSFGEIEETWGVDEQTGRFKGYALFVYKTAEAARAAIEEPMKIVDGHHMIVELAIDGKKKPGMVGNSSVVQNKVGDGGIAGFRTQNSIPGSMGNQYGATAAAGGGGGGGGGSVMGHYAFGSGGHHHLNPPLQSSIGLGLSGQTPNLIDGSMGLMAVSGIGGYGSGGGVEGERTTAIKEAQDFSMISFGAAAAAAAGGGGRGMGLYGLGSGGSGGHHHLNSPLQSSIGLGLSGQAPNSVGGSMGLTAASGIGGYGTGGFGGPKRTVIEEAITFADVAAGIGGSGMGFYGLKLGGHHHGLELSHQASSSIGGSMGSMAVSGIGGYGSGGFGGAQMKAQDPSTITFGDVAAGGGSGMGLYGLGSGGHHHLYSPLQSSIGLGLSGQAPNSIGGSTGLLTGSGIGGYGSGGVFGGAKTTVMDEAQDLSFDERMGKMMAHEVYTKYRTRDDEPIKKKGVAFTAHSDSETSEEVSENEAAFLSNEFRKFLRKNRFSKKRSRNEKDKEDSEEQDPIKCFRCNKSGHIKRDCPLLKDSSSNQKKEKKFKKIKEDSEEEDPMRCFKCNEPGHIKRDCPLLKDSSSNQKEEKKFKKCKDEEDSEEEDLIKCFRCNEFGHKRRDCPLRKDSSSNPNSNQKKEKKSKKQEDAMRCHRCREYGHLLKNCPLWDDSKNEKDKQDGKDSEEEDLRKCFNCNEFGHVKRNCPLWKDSSFNPKKNKKYESEGVEL